MAYASLWFDPFGHRTRVRDHRDGVWHGPALTLLGLAPTLAMIGGFVLCWIELVRRRGRTPEAPLVVLATLGLLGFTAIAVGAPVLRNGLLGLSCAAVGVSALVFTTGVLYPAQAMGVRVWTRIARVLPESYIYQAMERMLTGWM